MIRMSTQNQSQLFNFMPVKRICDLYLLFKLLRCVCFVPDYLSLLQALNLCYFTEKQIWLRSYLLTTVNADVPLISTKQHIIPSDLLKTQCVRLLGNYRNPPCAAEGCSSLWCLVLAPGGEGFCQTNMTSAVSYFPVLSNNHLFLWKVSSIWCSFFWMVNFE